MTEPQLSCVFCGGSFAADLWTLACDVCGRPLVATYPAHDYSRPSPPLPVDQEKLRSVSMGEGDTPVVSLPSIAARLGLRSLMAKLEYVAPTGSFKDRGAVVVMAMARRHGALEVVEDSSGNAGASLAAYAARMGVRAHVFAPDSAPEAKLAQVGAYGARVHRIEGPRQASADAAERFAKRHRLPYASHAISPYFVEGVKRFAYEVVCQTRHDPPEHVVIPVGNGSLLLGALKGYSELQRGGRVSTIPRLHAVQAENVMPIVAAFHAQVERPSSGATVAGGIAVARPARSDEIVLALRSAGGTAVAVSESDIVAWRAELAQTEGVFAELTSAAALAGLEALVQRGVIAPGESVLVPITGTGLKDAAHSQRVTRSPPQRPRGNQRAIPPASRR